MARIRTLKPEFWADEKLALLQPLTRLVFLGLISQADDAGRLVDNVKLLDGMLFPYTDDTCGDALDELAKMGRILRYRSDSGQPLIQLANWEKHQKVKNPSKYNLPAPSGERIQEPAEPSSVESGESRGRVERPDPRSPIPDHLPPTDDPREDRDRHRATCMEFVEKSGYGAKERLIAQGEDVTAWNTPTGDRVPWPDRLRLLRLAHARVKDGENRNLRSALRYVIPQQTDPFESPKSDAPKPGTEAAAVRAEKPSQHRVGGSTGGLQLIGPAPEPAKPVVDLEAEKIKRWADANPDRAERIRASIEARAKRGEGPRGALAQQAWAAAEFKVAALRATDEGAAA